MLCETALCSSTNGTQWDIGMIAPCPVVSDVSVLSLCAQAHSCIFRIPQTWKNLPVVISPATCLLFVSYMSILSDCYQSFIPVQQTPLYFPAFRETGVFAKRIKVSNGCKPYPHPSTATPSRLPDSHTNSPVLKQNPKVSNNGLVSGKISTRNVTNV